MAIQLTPDQQALAHQAVESGRLHHEEDAIHEALSLWEERERARAELLIAVDMAEASLARGAGRIITEQSMSDLAADLKQRGRARLASDRLAPRWWPTAWRRKLKRSSVTFGTTLPRKATAPKLPKGSVEVFVAITPGYTPQCGDCGLPSPQHARDELAPCDGGVCPEIPRV